MRAAQYSPLLIVGLVVALLAGLPVASVGLNLLSGGTSATWLHMTPEESSRCEQLHAWLNMEFDQRKAYDRNRGS